MHSSFLMLSFLFGLSLAQFGTQGVFKKAIGPCIDDMCPPGSACYYGQCIPAEFAPKMPVPDKDTVKGVCRYGGMCDADQFCYKKECYSYPKNFQD